MSLGTLTEKVDALRNKGFSNEEIDQLLCSDEMSTPTNNEEVDQSLILASLKKGDTQILQQFSKGKDPQTFNDNIDFIVKFKEKITIIQMGLFSLTFVISFLSMTYDPWGNVGHFFVGFSFVYGFLVMVIGNLYQYKILKPKLLYFIKK